MTATFFERYILPGLVFQSTMIAGAYGSGRELAEFFLPYGPLGGVFAMVLATLIFSLVLSVTLEFSRRYSLYDYRKFFRRLLGKGWILFEVLYLLFLLLVISVIGAAAGELLNDTFYLPNTSGTVLVMILIALLVFFGTPAIEKFLSLWSIVLYSTYITFLFLVLKQYGDVISHNFQLIPVYPGWAKSGFAYAGYNIALAPALLFCARHLTCSKDALIAGIIGGPIAMIPGMLFFVAMIGQYDVIIAEGSAGQLPISLLLGSLRNTYALDTLFPVVLFGTFVETGSALIHGFNERVSSVYEERGSKMPVYLRPAIAIIILLLSIVVANQIGLSALVTKGYGTITYGFLLIYVLPLLTYGVGTLARDSWTTATTKQERNTHD